jgi:hypothetical protein
MQQDIKKNKWRLGRYIFLFGINHYFLGKLLSILHEALVNNAKCYVEVFCKFWNNYVIDLKDTSYIHAQMLHACTRINGFYR